MLSDGALDAGLLSPVTVGVAAELSDEAVAGALIAAEVALVRAWAAVGAAPGDVADEISAALGWRGSGAPCELGTLSLDSLIAGSIAGGNPVIPLVPLLRDRVSAGAGAWVHRGATSQDILDSALMLSAYRSGQLLLGELRDTAGILAEFARDHRDDVVAARTLTQHAVPTTLGVRASGWLSGVVRAADRLAATLDELPAQLAGAGGTLASFVEIGGPDRAAALPGVFAAELGLAEPAGPWHTGRWPVTELGDALTQAVSALGVIAGDVAILSRTEIGELAEGSGGGSSAMPQKRNPTHSILIRSAAIRAPQLAATLHVAAALAVDERPDGSWHAEWPTLRELLRLARGAAAHAHTLTAGLGVDPAAAARNLAVTGPLIVAERLALVLDPVLGEGRVRELVATASADAATASADAAAGGGDRDRVNERDGAGERLAALLRAEPRIAAAGIDLDALLDPANYTGLAARIVDAAVRDARFTPTEDPA